METESSQRSRTVWRVVAAVEVGLAAIAVLADRFLPSLVILLIAVISLAYHRQGFASLGFRRPEGLGHMALAVLGITVIWTFLQVALFLPVIERVTGQRQDTADFAELQGNLAMFALLLVLTWTLAAVGEETAFRGFVQTRATQVFGHGTAGVVAAVLLTAVLFALIHTQQGVVGVCMSFVDSLLFSALLLRFGTLWAPILAHGFSNTIGFTVFFFIGPVYALW